MTALVKSNVFRKFLEIVRKARSMSEEEFHEFFSREVEDPKIVGYVNKLLKVSGEEPVTRPLTFLEVADFGIGHSKIQNCQLCDPEECDGLTVRAYKTPSGRVGVEWVFCKTKYKDMLIKRVEELPESTVTKILKQLRATSLHDLSISQLEMVLKEAE